VNSTNLSMSIGDSRASYKGGEACPTYEMIYQMLS
jgi:hypothetical protein